MPVDPNILLSSRPTHGMSSTDFVSAIGQIQQVREQTEARRLAAEERRAAAQEAAAIRQRERQVQDTLREAVAFDPESGEPTVDWTKVTGHLDPAVSFKVLDTINQSQRNALDLRTTKMEFGTKSKLYLGTVAAPPVKESHYDKKLWDLAATTAYNEGAMSRQEMQAALALTDPAEIQRYTDAAIQTAQDIMRAGSPRPASRSAPARCATTRAGSRSRRGARSPREPSTAYREWQDYKAEGGTLDFNAYQTADANRKATRISVGGSEPLVAIVGPDGQPVLVPRGQAVGQRPASANGARATARPKANGKPAAFTDRCSRRSARSMHSRANSARATSTRSNHCRRKGSRARSTAG